MRRIILLVVVLAAVALGWLWWRTSTTHLQFGIAPAPTIIKQPVNFANRTFDPENPPPDMPPMSPGELAVCDSNFISNANVGGEARQTDATHAVVTVTHVTITLQLNITIWVPVGAAAHVIEHEQGHREISEHFYDSADKLAAQIAAPYLGKKFLITSADLQSELSKSLRQLGADITENYDRELKPEPAQLRYDTITDHSRNDLAASDAVAQALQETASASTRPAGNKGN